MSLKLPPIPAVSRAAAAAARQRQDGLLKPLGSLGVLETLSVRLAAVRDLARPRLQSPLIIVAAGSHGVVREGVSAYPAEVTAQMVRSFTRGVAAINVLSDEVDAELLVVDAGVDGELPEHRDLHRFAFAAGTDNFARGPAMTRDAAERIVQKGIDFAVERARADHDLVALGDMGIGNTTSSAAVIAAALRCDPAEVVGRGAGIGDRALARKIELVRDSLRFLAPDPDDALDILRAVGGYEIGFLAGCAIGAASERVPVVLDGVITTAAAVLAWKLVPAVADYYFASHRSIEPAHPVALRALGLEPLFDFRLGLGEGSGAALAIPVLRAAARCLDEMATFDEAEVSGRSDS